MDHLDWVEGPDGWRSGRYHIERIAPSQWALSRAKVSSRAGLAPVTLETTTGSLAAAQRAAEVLESRTRRRARIGRHLGVFSLAALGVALGILVPSPLSAAGMVLATAVGARSLVVLVDAALGRPYESLRETFQ